MFTLDYIEKCLNLKGIIVKNIVNIAEEQHIYLSLPVQEQCCPHCGHLTSYIKDYREQRIKDLGAFGSTVYLHVRKRRYVCKKCSKTFYEKNTFLARYQRATNRFALKIIEEIQAAQPFSQIAKRFSVSISTVLRKFSIINFPKPKLPGILSIDEFRGNAGGEKFQCVLTSPSEHKVLDILPSRNTGKLQKYFLSFNREERKQVKTIVMDMSNVFRSIAEDLFPCARIVADKFHVIRLVSWDLDKVRKQEQLKMSKTRRIYFKRSKKLLLSPRSKLSDEDKAAVNVILSLSPRLSRAYALKEEFYKVFGSKTKFEAKRALGRWLWLVDKAGLEEFKNCRLTFRRWFEAITNIIKYQVTNGFTEGINNKIKVLKRVSYGIKTFKILRNRVLFSKA